MNKLYKKSEIWFAIIWIIIYVVGTSFVDGITLGIPKLLTFVFLLTMSILLVAWLGKNGLLEEYGLCKAKASAKRFLFYIPLAVLVSGNLWFGVRMNMPLAETVFYILSMICVGFVEELIFRGFLFKAMAKDNIKSAIIVSSVTFGIGHIVNLFNANAAELIPTICQIISAVAFGFLFVIIFHRGGSLLPCIFAHSIINSLSAFSPELENMPLIIYSAVLTVIAAGYTLVLHKTLPKAEKKG